MSKIDIEEVGSAEDLIKEEEDRKANREAYNARKISRVPGDKGITIRLADNPGPRHWLKVYQLWEPNIGTKGMYLPAKKSDTNSRGEKALERYLVNCIDTKENKAIVLNLAWTVKEILMRKYNKNNTLTDRDWTITLYGKDYEVDAEKETDRDLDRFEFANLAEVWQAEADSVEAYLSENGSEAPKKKSLE